MGALDVIWAAVFLALTGWFVVRNRERLEAADVRRHIIVMLFVWGGCMACLHGM